MNRKEGNRIMIEQNLKENGLGDNDELTIANIRKAITIAISENSEVYKEEAVDKAVGRMLGKF